MASHLLFLKRGDLGEDMSELEAIRSSSEVLKKETVSTRLSSSVALSEFDSEALLTMARLQRTLKNFSESLQYFQFAYEVEPQFSTIMEWAHVLLDQGLVAQSLQLHFRALNELTLSESERFLLYKDIGNICLRSQDIDGAEENYHRAFALCPDSDALLVNMGTLELQRECWEQAKARFRESLVKNRRNENAWLGLALVHRQFGDVELAWANLLESLDIQPQYITALQLLTDWAYRDGRLQSAIGALEQAGVTKSSDKRWQLVLAQMYFDLGNLEAAAAHVEDILNQSPLIEGGAELLSQIERKRYEQRTAVASEKP